MQTPYETNDYRTVTGAVSASLHGGFYIFNAEQEKYRRRDTVYYQLINMNRLQNEDFVKLNECRLLIELHYDKTGNRCNTVFQYKANTLHFSISIICIFNNHLLKHNYMKSLGTH